MPYKFFCPHCAQRIAAETDVQYTQVKCPTCNGVFIAPPADGGKPSETAKATNTTQRRLPRISARLKLLINDLRLHARLLHSRFFEQSDLRIGSIALFVAFGLLILLLRGGHDSGSGASPPSEPSPRTGPPQFYGDGTGKPYRPSSSSYRPAPLQGQSAAAEQTIRELHSEMPGYLRREDETLIRALIITAEEKER